MQRNGIPAYGKREGGEIMSFEEYWSTRWKSVPRNGILGRVVKDIARHAWDSAIAEKDRSAQVAHHQNLMDAYEITERTSL